LKKNPVLLMLLWLNIHAQLSPEIINPILEYELAGCLINPTLAASQKLPPTPSDTPNQPEKMAM
jgi:hypothetical protein